MSKLPRIYSNHSENHKGYLQSHTPESQRNNQIDYGNMSQLNQTEQSSKYNPLGTEIKFVEFESKIIALEEANKLLLTRLKETEDNFDMKLQHIQRKADSEIANRFKAEKTISDLNDNSNSSAADLKVKINLIQEFLEKEEKWKIEQRNKDIDMYKKLINKLTEKVSTTVKMEVDARFRADMDQQNNLQSVTNKFEVEIESIRKDLEDFMGLAKQELIQSSKDCSERTHNASKYIEQQIFNASKGSGTSIDNLKNFVAKLTEQVKANLISQTIYNDGTDSRLKKIEEFLPTMKEGLYNYVSTVEDRIIQKIKDIKLYSEVNINKVNDAVNIRIDEFAENIDKNNQVLAKHIFNTRDNVNEKFKQVERDIKDHFKVTCEDFVSITNRLYQYENIIQQNNTSSASFKTKIIDEFNAFKVYIDLQAVNERIMKRMEDDIIRDNVRACIESVSKFDSNFETNMTEINKNAEMMNIGLIEKIEFLEKIINLVSEKDLEMFTKIENDTTRIETRQMLNEMIFKAEDDSQNEIINKTKKDLAILTKTTGSTTTELTNIINQQKEDNARETGVNRAIETMLNNVDSMARILQSTAASNENEAGLLKALDSMDNKLEAHNYSNNKEFNVLREMIEESSNAATMASETIINLSLRQMVTNAEFGNVYNELNKVKAMSSTADMQNKMDNNNDITKKVLANYGDMMDSKVAKALEKIKQDNVNMWVQAVELSQKYTQSSNEIRKIIKEIPPVVLPISDTLKRIMDVNFDNRYQNPSPIVPALNQKKKEIEAIKDRRPPPSSSIDSNQPDTQSNKNNPNTSQQQNKPQNPQSQQTKSPISSKSQSKPSKK